MSFDAYCFSVNDVIRGLNEYYSRCFDGERPFLMIENGVVDEVRRDKVYFSKFIVPETLKNEDRKISFILICDPAETAVDAIK